MMLKQVLIGKLLIIGAVFFCAEVSAGGRDWNIVSADLDGNGQEEVIISFGNNGLWAWMNNASWSKLHDIPPSAMATGDMDGNGKADLVIDFGPNYGIWLRKDDASWTQLDTKSSNYLVMGDLDNNGQSDIIASFNEGGTWVLQNNQPWVKIHALTSRSITIGNLDGNATPEVLFNFSQFGLWAWMNANSWLGLYWDGKDLLDTATWKHGAGDYFLYQLSGYGMYSIISILQNNQTNFHDVPFKTNGYPVQIKSANIDGSGIDEVLASFDNGLWAFMNDTAWVKIHDMLPGDFSAADVDGNGQKDIIIDFLQYGMWIYFNNSSWVPLHTDSPTLLNTSPNGSGVIPHKEVNLQTWSGKTETNSGFSLEIDVQNHKLMRAYILRDATFICNDYSYSTNLQETSYSKNVTFNTFGETPSPRGSSTIYISGIINENSASGSVTFPSDGICFLEPLTLYWTVSAP